MKVLTLRAAKQDAEGALIVQRYATFEILTVGGQSGVDRVSGVVNGDGVEENPITANIAGLAKVGAPDGDYDVLKTNPDGSTERETLTWFDEKAARDVVVVARGQVIEAQSDVADMAAQVEGDADRAEAARAVAEARSRLRESQAVAEADTSIIAGSYYSTPISPYGANVVRIWLRTSGGSTQQGVDAMAAGYIFSDEATARAALIGAGAATGTEFRYFGAADVSGLKSIVYAHITSTAGAGASVVDSEFLTASQLEETSVRGAYPTGTSTGATAVADATYTLMVPFPRIGAVTKIAVLASNAQAGIACVVSLDGSNNETLIAQQPITLAAGSNLLDVDLAGAAGQFLAIKTTANGIALNSGQPSNWRYCSGLPGSGTATIAGNQGIQIGYLYESGSALDVRRLQRATASLVAGSRIYGTYPEVDGTGTLVANVGALARYPAAEKCVATGISFRSGSSTSGYVYVASVSAGNVYLKPGTLRAVTAASGTNTLTDWNPVLEAGEFPAVYLTAAALRYRGSGAGIRTTTGLPSESGTASTVSANLDACISWTANYGSAVIDAAESAARAAADTAIQAQITGGSTTGGMYPAADQANSLAAGFTGISDTVLATPQVITGVSFWTASAGAGLLALVTLDGSNNISAVHATKDVTIAAGSNLLAWRVTAPAGSRVAVYCSAAGLDYATTGGAGARYCSGPPTVGLTTSGFGSTTRFALGWSSITGLEPRLAAVEATDATAAGIGLITSAQQSGDATATFAAAIATHPHPYVPPGNYAVTALPAAGRGFWGDGNVNVNGVRYSLPAAPRDGGLLLALRSRFAGLAVSGSPLVLGPADSLGAHFAATTLARHWFNRLEDFLNEAYAPGSEPSTVVLRNDDGTTGETAAFYGITVSGGGNGTTGPVGKSVVLSDGGYIEFSGAYSTVEVFYDRASGGGTLTRTYNASTNGAPQSAAGAAAFDQLSAFGATGQTASGTYRITASGGPVTLTGLLRLAPKLSTPGLANPIRCMRVAYGGYSGGSYTTQRLDSMIAQAKALGPNPAYIGAHMTNDMLFSSAPRPSNFESNLNREIDKLQGDGAASDIFWMTPPRPRFSSWGSNYTSGQSFDTFLEIAIRVCRAQGVQMIRLDEIDFDGEGLLSSDNLHWNDAGQLRVVDAFARSIVGAS